MSPKEKSSVVSEEDIKTNPEDTTRGVTERRPRHRGDQEGATGHGKKSRRKLHHRSKGKEVVVNSVSHCQKVK